MKEVAAELDELLGICFWRKVREERIWAEFMGEKGGWQIKQLTLILNRQ